MSALEQCRALRTALLTLHRALIGLERKAYEKQHGPHSAGDFLQVMAYADEMRWLEPLSRVIVMLDESIDEAAADAPASADCAAVVAGRLRDLLRIDREAVDDFSTRYIPWFDASPELVAAHADVVRLLKS